MGRALFLILFLTLCAPTPGSGGTPKKFIETGPAILCPATPVTFEELVGASRCIFFGTVARIDSLHESDGMPIVQYRFRDVVPMKGAAGQDMRLSVQGGWHRKLAMGLPWHIAPGITLVRGRRYLVMGGARVNNGYAEVTSVVPGSVMAFEPDSLGVMRNEYGVPESRLMRDISAVLNSPGPATRQPRTSPATE